MKTLILNNFIAALSTADKNYISKALGISNYIELLIAKTRISKKDFCLKFKIRSIDYARFISGAFNYTLEHMSILNGWYAEVEMEELKNREPIQIPKSQPK